MLLPATAFGLAGRTTICAKAALIRHSQSDSGFNFCPESSYEQWVTYHLFFFNRDGPFGLLWLSNWLSESLHSRAGGVLNELDFAGFARELGLGLYTPYSATGESISFVLFAAPSRSTRATGKLFLRHQLLLCICSRERFQKELVCASPKKRVNQVTGESKLRSKKSEALV